ncbi:MAG: trifunctional transcriptional activator/DNA repair protein Ada/methylated-DNA--[protein]-cysteine S-methyltransferase [Rhodobacteraceae bacterium]|nr:trifunctional transcriptional activator/DNA repair protein Ada/methylated-DNA--[protein]-cysteine S-methyltransferase [Paracoccaceae bacterium]
MMFDLPNHATLYAALVVRDLSFDGRAFIAVKTTGIFCRFGCPARRPNPENCHFYASVAECLEAGYRPCKRCHPLRPAAEADPAVQSLLSALEASPGRRWSEGDIIARGYDPSTIRRAFKRHYGLTFLEMARLSRLRFAAKALGNGQRVIDAQLDAGFASPAAFRAAFARLLGAAPGSFKANALLRADWLTTPLGDLIAVSDQHALHLLEFADRKALPKELQKLRMAVKGNIGFGRFAATDQVEAELKAFFNGENMDFKTPLALNGTPFTRQVWQALRQIPAGETRSYSSLAASIGKPAATRAVARANGANQIAILIPCHRVIGADGSLTGYGGGLWRKQKLIELEARFKNLPA